MIDTDPLEVEEQGRFNRMASLIRFVEQRGQNLHPFGYFCFRQLHRLAKSVGSLRSSASASRRVLEVSEAGATRAALVFKMAERTVLSALPARSACRISFQ